MARPVIRNLELPPGRLMVISDVHGDLACLKTLVEKLSPTPEDRFLFLGDLVEKGPESLATLRFVMGLCGEGRAEALCGNCDNVHLLVYGGAEAKDDLLRYALSWRESGHSLLWEMNRELGITLTEDTDAALWTARLLEHFPEEFRFLRSLPHVLETPEFRFVHGGLRPGPREAWDAWDLMKYDAFETHGEPQDRWCVVGHWPATLYSVRHPCLAPHVNREKKIISIDGGRSVKSREGQLNALILRNGHFTWESEDLLPETEARDAQAERLGGLNTHWPDFAVDLLEDHGDFVRLRHRSTGTAFVAPKGMLWETEDGLGCADCTDYHLPVRPGDKLKVLYRTAYGAYCKKESSCGWYFGRLLD